MKFKKIPEKIRSLIQKKDNLVILVLTGILLLVIAWPVSGTEKENNSMSDLWDRKSGNIVKNNDLENENNNFIDYNSQMNNEFLAGEGKKEEYLEKKLEEFLSSIHGVGRVKVMISLEDYGEKVVEKDIPLERSNIAESDSEGGNRNTSEMSTQETTIYATNAQGEKIPYIRKEKLPLVEGVTVVAEGGGSASVQKDISDVIQALFGIEAHKIIVVKMKQEE